MERRKLVQYFARKCFRLLFQVASLSPSPKFVFTADCSVYSVCSVWAGICVSNDDCGEPNNKKLSNANGDVGTVDRKSTTISHTHTHPHVDAHIHILLLLLRSCSVCKLFLIRSHHLISRVWAVWVVWSFAAAEVEVHDVIASATTLRCTYRRTHVATVFLNIFIYSRIPRHLRLKQ